MAFVSRCGSDDDFMFTAFKEALNSQDPSTKVGACVANKNGEILGKGFNRFPKISKNFDESYPWNREVPTWNEWLESKYAYILFAEIDAITNCLNFDDSTLYTLIHPSNVGAQLVVEKGIKKVVYYSDKHQNAQIIEASRRILRLAEVEVKKFQPRDENRSFFDKIAQITIEIPK